MIRGIKKENGSGQGKEGSKDCERSVLDWNPQGTRKRGRPKKT
jgi:hypothetical protein